MSNIKVYLPPLLRPITASFDRIITWLRVANEQPF